MTRAARALRAVGWGAAAGIPLVFLGVFFLWPVLSLVSVGLNGDFGSGSATDGAWAATIEVLSDPRTKRAIWNTCVQALSATLLAVLLGVPLAFVLYRLQFRGQGFLRGLSAVPFVLPTVVVGVAFLALFGEGSPLYWLGLDRSFLAVVLALVFFNVTVVSRTVGGFWSQLDDRTAQAARTLGASPARVFVTVTLPALAPAISAAAALVFLFCATSFGVVLIVGGGTFANLETEIYQLTVQFLDLRSAAILSLLQVVVVAIVLLGAAWLRSRQEQAQPMRHFSSAGAKPERSHLPAIAVVILTAVFLHAAPIIALVSRSLTDATGAVTFDNYAGLFSTRSQQSGQVDVLGALWVSVQFAVVAAAIALVLGLLVTLVVSRKPRQRLLRQAIAVFDGAIMLPLGVSAVTLGFGLLLTMHAPLGIGFDLRTSAVLIPIAQALIALPLVVRALLPTLRALDPQQRDAAAVLGASPLRVLSTIDLRILARPFGVAVGLALATSLGEFGATAFLVRPGEQTLPVLIAELIGKQGADNYGMALAAAVLLGLITAIIMVCAEHFRGRSNNQW